MKPTNVLVIRFNLSELWKIILRKVRVVYQSLQDFAILRSLNLSQNQANCNFRKSSQIFVIAADFGLRRVPWRHRNAHSVKEMFLSLKNGMNSLAFSSCPIYKSYIGQTNRKWNEYALLVWATRRRRLSAQAGAVGCSRSRDTVIHSAGRYSEESSRIRHRINNICQILWEAFKFGAEFC